jgi:hypothetical protein
VGTGQTGGLEHVAHLAIGIFLLCLLKLADLLFYKKASHWITINYPMLAYVRKITYLSAAKNSNKEYLTYGKGKYKI